MTPNITEQEAIELQQKLAKKVVKKGKLTNIRYVAGTDVAYAKNKKRLIAAVVVIDIRTMEVVEQVVVEDEERFPYIPGLFSFREMPPLMKAFEQLKIRPDVVIIDGQGLAHPRRFGLACHFGVHYNIPSIGCGKTRLIGTFAPVGEKRGDFSPLVDGEELIGSVLRTQDGINPLFISIGHKVDLKTARQIVLKLCTQYRQPETTRKADELANRMLKG
ncbi:MAG: deoxyribonuclease V [Bacteroidetes bacterium]|nr:MAG: deoxyribonuclease V [Bacteroidota bacterium]